ncbi:LemA family protein [Oscillospiraceae bacterium CM]|nr:LemA family protein [Oscillospiraceae bacterium CM]
MGWIIVGIVVIILIIWFISAYNRFVSLRNRVEEAFSTMDVYLKKRYDLVPNLVETVKGYAKHESTTFENIVKARSMAMGAQSLEERAQGENMLTGTLKSLFALAENYPELKANQNFLDLQGQLAAIENDIMNSRKYYNAIVREFNIAREAFPSVIVANMMHLEKKPMFEIDGAERQNVKVQF